MNVVSKTHLEQINSYWLMCKVLSWF